MKMRAIITIIISIVLSCNKESNSKREVNNSNLHGTWVNVMVSQDTIQISDSIIKRWNNNAKCFCHLYRYYFKGDSVILSYLGIDKVAFIPFHKEISLNLGKDTLTIKKLNSVYPSIPGDVFKKLKIN